jgi:hypothetical protein
LAAAAFGRRLASAGAREQGKDCANTIIYSRKKLLVLGCGHRVRADAGAQLPMATQCPWVLAKEQAMIRIGLIIIIAVIMPVTVRRIRRRP